MRWSIITSDARAAHMYKEMWMNGWDDVHNLQYNIQLVFTSESVSIWDESRAHFSLLRS
jgi:hypothetical protein